MALLSKNKLKTLPAQPSSTIKHTVLVVDDERFNRQIMISILKDHFNVLEAENGATALALVSKPQRQEPLSIVISDQRMPDMTGIELFEQLSHLAPQTMRIIVTGFLDVGSLLDSINKAHIYQFILKPFEHVELLNTIKQAATYYELFNSLKGQVKRLGSVSQQNYRINIAKNQALQSAYHQLEQLTLNDPLTGLKNKQFLKAFLSDDVLVISRYNQKMKQQPNTEPMELIFFIVALDASNAFHQRADIDFTDKVMKSLKVILEQIFTPLDYLVRLSETQVLVVAKHTHFQQIIDLAKRLHNAIADQPMALTHQCGMHQTCSIGFSGYPLVHNQPHLVNWQQMIKIALIAAQAAKYSGGNAWIGISANQQLADQEAIQQLLTDMNCPIPAKKIHVVTNLTGKIQWGQSRDNQ